MLQRTLSELTSTAAVCLFIDGLDEFVGKHDDLLLFLKHLVDKTPVKMCVASRPWEVFEDAFQNKPSLRLEDLTYPDIKSFVTSRFQSDDNFLQLERREAEFAGQLVEEVVRKASGVFLWVRLVVSSLLDGMTETELPTCGAASTESPRSSKTSKIRFSMISIPSISSTRCSTSR